jgi:HD-GYP domain-containing protein (c-di-GMP phosphodiesterase class II)
MVDHGRATYHRSNIRSRTGGRILTTDLVAEGTTVRVHDAMQALAFVGDLSMGQPCNHSRRVAALARRLALALGRAELAADATSVALLRWSGCTANAGEVAALLGDDVAGRAKMLAEPALLAQLQVAALTDPAQRERLAAFAGVAQIHCEVAGDTARRLGLPATVEQALRHVFDGYDLEGRGGAATELVAIVTLCGEFEIAARLHGAGTAPAAHGQHPRVLVEALHAQGGGWLAEIDEAREDAATQVPDAAVPLALLADVIDLKLPWLTGHSRAVASAVEAAGPRLGLDPAAVHRTIAAALLHGMGRAALPNALWSKQAPLSRAEQEQVRLAAYWTARAARELGGLSAEADLASWVFERDDGSGHFRGLAPQGAEARLLAAAASWVALRSARPWRPAFDETEAVRILREEARAGRYDREVVEALLGAPAPRPRATPTLLSPRELDVLRAIARGASNKEAAQRLGISPATVRTHLEHVFEKLACSSRAAATLKAVELGLL